MIDRRFLLPVLAELTAAGPISFGHIKTSIAHRQGQSHLEESRLLQVQTTPWLPRTSALAVFA
jgi:hypothetical protein